MHLDPKSQIDGFPVLEVRRLLRQVRFDGLLSFKFIMDDMYLSRRDTESFIACLKAEGLLEDYVLDKELHPSELQYLPYYQLTPKGSQFRAASATKQLHRKTADRLLADFIERIEALNGNPYYLGIVKKAVVFGSYLGTEERISDIDIALELDHREPDLKKFETLQRARVNEQMGEGRTFGIFIDELGWWEREAYLYLKNRKRGLSLHDWAVDQTIVKSGRHQIVYPVQAKGVSR
jgi:hypothetical protein